MKAFLIILSTFLLASCGSVQESTKTQETVSDSTSVNVKEVKRDTVIEVPGDTTKVSIPVFDLDEKPQHFESNTKRSSLTIRKVNDTLDIDCKCERYKEQIQLLDKIIKRQRKIITTKKTEKSVPVKFTPWYMKALGWVGALALFAVTVFTAFTIFKPKI